MKKGLYYIIFVCVLAGCSQNGSEVPYDPHTETSYYAEKRWDERDFPIKIYVPTELSQFKQNITNSAKVWNDGLGTTVFEVVLNPDNCVQGTSDCYPNTQWAGPLDSLYDNYFGLFKMLTWSFPKIDSGVLAFTGTLTQNGKIIHADILFNFKNYQFVNISDTSDPAMINKIDYESVLTHELGHFLGLNHIETDEDGISIMNPTLRKGQTKRSLSSGDIYRIKTLYNMK